MDSSWLVYGVVDPLFGSTFGRVSDDGCCNSHIVVVDLSGDEFPCLLHRLK